MIGEASAVVSSGTAFLKNIYNFASCSQVAGCVVLLVELREDA